MSNKYFSYSFQVHRTRKTIIIFIIFVIVLVGGFLLFYRSKRHIDKIDKLSYDVVLGMNEFEDNSCDKIYRMSYKESTCGTVCVNVSKSDKNFLNTTKDSLKKNGFTVGKIKEKEINKNNWSYFTTSKATPSISYYAIDYGNKLYSIEIINQTEYLSKTKAKECNKGFNKMLKSIKLK